MDEEILTSEEEVAPQKEKPVRKAKASKAVVELELSNEERFIDSLNGSKEFRAFLKEQILEFDFGLLHMTPASHDWKVHELLRAAIADYSRASIGRVRKGSTAKEFVEVIEHLDNHKEASWVDIFHFLTQANAGKRFFKFIEESNNA